MKSKVLETDPELLNRLILSTGVDTNKISDGYHTFGELYDHRFALFVALSSFLYSDAPKSLIAWKSKVHHDGSSIDGWFIAGIETEKGKQISYHLPLKYWDKVKVPEYEKAPEWDGHTSQDVIERLLKGVEI